MTTATTAACGPMASTPAETVLACTDSPLLVKSFAMESNSPLNASAPRDVIIAVSRSRLALGLCGANVAEASAALLAMPTTSVPSLWMAASGAVHCV